MGANHVRVLNDMDDVELVGVADTNPDALSAVSRRYHVAPFDDYLEMLEKASPDVVGVAAPTRTHEAVTSDALRSGAHVLVEKPLAASAAAGRRIVGEANRLGLQLMTGHIERFNPAVRELKRRLDAREAGRVVRISARRLSPGPGRVDDVGVVLDLATHDLDVILYLMGSNPSRVYAEVERHTGSKREDVLSAILRFPEGAIAALDVNWLTPTKVRELAVTGERGMFVVDYLGQDLTFYRNEIETPTWEALQAFRGVSVGEVVKFKITKQEPLRLEWESFVQSVADSGQVRNVDDGVAALDLAEALLLSATEHRVVNT